MTFKEIIIITVIVIFCWILGYAWMMYSFYTDNTTIGTGTTNTPVAGQSATLAP